MRLRRNKGFLAGSILAAFFMAGCGDPGAASRMEKDMAALHKAIERKNEEVRSINARMEAQSELIAKQELDLKKTLAMIREEIGNFRSEIVSMRNGEMVSLKTDLDLLQKRIEVVMSKLKKMSGDSGPPPPAVSRLRKAPSSRTGGLSSSSHQSRRIFRWLFCF